MDISVVIPLLDERDSLDELMHWIDRVMIENNFSYEVVFIDDGSTDNSWEEITRLKGKFSSIKGIRFQRNYGKSAALHVGFAAAQGEVVFTMDADLQDSPDEIPAMYKMVKEDGYHLVSGWKKKRFDPLTKTIPTKFYNAATRFMSGVKLNDMNCGLKAYQNQVIKSIEVYGEMHRYIPVIAKWAGFTKIGEKVVAHQARKHGKTKFGISRFINGPLDLASIMFVGKFGKRPMHFFGSIGMVMFGLGFLLFAYLGGYKIYALANAIPAKNIATQSSFFIALTVMIIGVQLFVTGFLAELVSRNSADRNNYLIREKI